MSSPPQSGPPPYSRGSDSSHVPVAASSGSGTQPHTVYGAQYPATAPNQQGAFRHPHHSGDPQPLMFVDYDPARTQYTHYYPPPQQQQQQHQHQRYGAPAAHVAHGSPNGQQQQQQQMQYHQPYYVYPPPAGQQHHHSYTDPYRTYPSYYPPQYMPNVLPQQPHPPPGIPEQHHVLYVPAPLVPDATQPSPGFRETEVNTFIDLLQRAVTSSGQQSVEDSFLQASQSPHSVRKSILDRLRSEPTFLQSRENVQWLRHYYNLVVLRERNGHSRVPNSYAEGSQVRAWCNTQRKRMKNGELSAVRKSLLDVVDFEWQPEEARWERCFQTLSDHREEFPCCKDRAAGSSSDQNSRKSVKRKQLTDEERTEIRTWINTQRKKYKSDNMDEKRKSKLDDIGFVWEPDRAKWMRMYRSLHSFYRQTGHSNVPQRYDADLALGAWVNSQRKNRKRGMLDTDKIRLLDDLKFQWAIRLMDDERDDSVAEQKCPSDSERDADGVDDANDDVLENDGGDGTHAAGECCGEIKEEGEEEEEELDRSGEGSSQGSEDEKLFADEVEPTPSNMSSTAGANSQQSVCEDRADAPPHNEEKKP